MNGVRVGSSVSRKRSNLRSAFGGQFGGYERPYNPIKTVQRRRLVEVAETISYTRFKNAEGLRFVFTSLLLTDKVPLRLLQPVVGVHRRVTH